MAYHNKITAEQIRENLQKRIDEVTAELRAVRGITIDTKQKTLTNRAISGDGAKIDNYLGINKALFVSYLIKYKDGATRYETTTITAYSYTDLDGNEIGTNGIMRISRTITPTELLVIVRDIVESRANTIGELQSEYRRAGAIAKKQNALIDKIDEFNKNLSYASEAQL